MDEVLVQISNLHVGLYQMKILLSIEFVDSGDYDDMTIINFRSSIYIYVTPKTRLFHRVLISYIYPSNR